MASLTPQDEIALLLASRTPVVDGLARLDFKTTGLLLPNGHLAANGIQPNQAPNNISPIPETALAEYFGIAAPTHCADGWSYLSRALNAYLLGDAHSAWHFAYYAELRAAQSILSASGCGAFNSWNCILDDSGNLHLIGNAGNKQTHTMVWLALEFLAGCSSSASISIAGAMRLFDVSLPDIIQYAYPGRSATATSSNWISSWIYDLQTSSADKGFRNRCSYNPHFVTPHRADIGEYVNLVTELWQILEPSPRATFMELDKHIVRAAIIKEAKESLILKNIPETPAELESELNSAYLNIIGAAPNFRSIHKEFFVNGNAPEHPLLKYASDNSGSPDTPRPVLARATLLLRIATGITQNLLLDAYQHPNMDFWLDSLAEQQGIVEESSEIPENRADLYQECLLATEDLERHYKNNSTLASLINNHEVKPHLISQAERIVQWSFIS